MPELRRTTPAEGADAAATPANCREAKLPRRSDTAPIALLTFMLMLTSET